MRVPVYDAPHVATGALPEVRSRLDMRTGLDAVGRGVEQVGQGVQRAVDAVEREHQVAAEKAAAGASTDAENAFANDALTELHGSPDGSKKGYFQSQGKDALAGSAGVQERLQQLQQKYAEKLSPAAKALFVPRSKAMLLSWRGAVEKYAGDQAEAANKAAAKALGETAARIASLQYADDKTVETASAAAETALATQLHGMPPEVVQAELNQQRQHVAANRVAAAVTAKDLPAAERLLAAYGEQLGTARPALERQVVTLKAQQLGEKNAQTLMEFARDPDSGLVDQAKLENGYQAMDPKAKTPEFQHAFDAKRTAALALDKGTKAEAFQAAYTAYTRAGNNLNAVPPSVKAWMVAHDGKAWEDMKAIARRDAAGHGGRSSSPGDPAQLAALNELRWEVAKDPDKFAAMSPAELARDWAPRLSPAGFREAGVLHAKVVAAAQRPDKETKLSTLVQSSVINAAAHAFGEVNPKTKLPTSPSKWSADHHRLLDQVLNDVQEQDKAYRKAHNGQGAPADQLEKWARDQLVKGTVKGSGFLGFFGDEETAVEARAKGDVLLDENGNEIGAPPATALAGVSAAGLNLDAPAGEAPAVPAMDRALIQAAFRNKGRPAPTEEQIRAIYARRQGTP